MDILARVDDKYIPLYRILWVSDLPHFCGHEDCEKEGRYEFRLEQGESVWGSQVERDDVIASLRAWQGGLGQDQDEGF